MSKEKFAHGDLILVDTHPNATHERWEPGVYLGELPTGNHAVEVMVDGERVERVYPDHCLKRADEALALKVHYEVYIDAFGSSASHFESREKALAWAEELATKKPIAPNFALKDDVVVDKVLVGGYRKIAVYSPAGAE